MSRYCRLKLVVVAVRIASTNSLRNVFGGDVAHVVAGVVPLDVVDNCVQQVRFAQADAAMDEQRVIRAAGFLSDGLGRSMSEAVRCAGNERLERVPRVDHRRGRSRC